MSLSSLELWQRLARQGLASPEQCQQWAADIHPTLSADSENGLKLLQRLIELGHVSKYQAKILAGQATGPLRWGAWWIEQSVKHPLWQGWYLVRRGTETPRWGRPVTADDLNQLRDARPSLPRALKLSTIQHASLIAVQPPELVDGILLIFVAPAAAIAAASSPPESTGALLSQRFASARCAPDEALRIVSQIADALAAMHQLGLAHGRVMPDRIYVQEQQSVLVVDPLCAATGLPHEPAASLQTANSPLAGLIGQDMLPAQQLRFSAPELQLPNPQPTPASDVFSLGCVWWWLLTGEPPAAAIPSQSNTQAHPAGILSLPTGCVLPEPLWRCLKASLGKNPSSRFASAGELTQALAAAKRARPIPAVAAVAEPLKAQPKQPTPASAAQAPKTPAAAPAASKIATPGRGKPLPKPTLAPATGSAGPTVPTVPTVPTARRRRKRKGVPWLWPILGGCGALAGLLIALKLSGALQFTPASREAGTAQARNAYIPPSGNALADNTPPPPSDPRSEFYQIVAAEPGANPNSLWAPPHAPAPLPLDLLPPGGQLFVSLLPAQWTRETGRAEVQAAFDNKLSHWLETLRGAAGVPLAEIEQFTLAFYAPDQSGQSPRVAWRFRLLKPKSLGELKASWNNPTIEDIAEHQLLVSSTELAYFVAGQPQTDAQPVSEFSAGPLELMRDVAELSGARGPLLPQLEKLWNESDRSADVAMLVSTPFLFTDGRDLLGHAPPRLSKYLKQWLGGDARGASLHMHWGPQWYLETRVVGTNDLEAGKIMTRQQQQVQDLPTNVEQWLVVQAAHPYWRALALRYPHMLRTFVDYARFGVEQGTALMNCYLPREGGANLLLSTWIALQDQSTLASSNPALASATGDNDSSKPFDIESLLRSPIRLSFDQEPIEVALRLVGEEANAQLPPGTPPVRFALDGDAFEKAGITRNQQLRDFRFEQQTVRDALTEIAKRGNPDRTVSDLRQVAQNLMWIVMPDPESANQAPMISLTTRVAATAAGHKLPEEFAP